MEKSNKDSTQRITASYPKTEDKIKEKKKEKGIEIYTNINPKTQWE